MSDARQQCSQLVRRSPSCRSIAPVAATAHHGTRSFAQASDLDLCVRSCIRWMVAEAARKPAARRPPRRGLDRQLPRDVWTASRSGRPSRRDSSCCKDNHESLDDDPARHAHDHFRRARSQPLPDRSLRPLRATPRRPAPRLDRASALPPPAGHRRPGRRLSQRPPRLRQFHAAGRAEGLLARAVLQPAKLRHGDGPHRPGRVQRRQDPARLAARRAELHRAQPHPHHGNGVGRRLRPRPPAHPRDARPRPAARQPSPLGIHQQRDRHRRPRAAAAQAGHRRRRSSASACRRSPRCTAKRSSTATSSRRTSWSSAPATRRSSTSARRCT